MKASREIRDAERFVVAPRYRVQSALSPSVSSALFNQRRRVDGTLCRHSAVSHDALICMTIKTRLCRDLERLNNSARLDLYCVATRLRSAPESRDGSVQPLLMRRCSFSREHIIF